MGEGPFYTIPFPPAIAGEAWFDFKFKRGKTFCAAFAAGLVPRRRVADRRPRERRTIALRADSI